MNKKGISFLGIMLIFLVASFIIFFITDLVSEVSNISGVSIDSNFTDTIGVLNQTAGRVDTFATNSLSKLEASGGASILTVAEIATVGIIQLIMTGLDWLTFIPTAMTELLTKYLGIPAKYIGLMFLGILLIIVFRIIYLRIRYQESN